MKQFLAYSIFTTLLGCGFWAQKDWEKTPEIITASSNEIVLKAAEVENNLCDLDSLQHINRQKFDAQKKAINWQSSQIEYLNRGYGTGAPYR